MKKNTLALFLLLFIYIGSFSQGIGIGTINPDSSAALDIVHSTKGLLVPRMTTTAMLAIPGPARGLIVYDSLANQLMVNVGTALAPNWEPVVNSASGWTLAGNSGINPSNQFVGTIDNQPLRFRINNIPTGELNPFTGSIFWGLRSGKSNTSGFSNVGIGPDALSSNTTASNLVRSNRPGCRDEHKRRKFAGRGYEYAAGAADAGSRQSPGGPRQRNSSGVHELLDCPCQSYA